jgi:hypothetical protein
MSFEVLEPTWEDLIAKISIGKVSNVDQVLQIHSDFLSTCLNDCLLSNTQLLSTVKKLLGVCSEFSYYMNELVRTQHMFSRILNFLFVIVFSRKKYYFQEKITVILAFYNLLKFYFNPFRTDQSKRYGKK